MKKTILPVLMCSILIGCGGGGGNAPIKPSEPVSSTIYLLSKEDVSSGSVRNNVYTNSWGNPVFNHPKIDVRVQGGEEFRHTPTWDTFPYTGTEYHTALSAKEQWTSGNYPPSFVSYNGGEVGLYINTEQLQRFQIMGGGAHSVWSYVWDWKDKNKQVFPFKNNQTMVVSFKYKVPFMEQYDIEGGDRYSVPQLNFGIYGEDQSDDNNHLIWGYFVGLYDSRGSYEPFLLHDGVNYFISTPLQDNDYMKLIKGKHASETFDEWIDVEFHITPRQLQNSIDVLNEGFEVEGQKLSEVENLIIKSVIIILELQPTDGVEIASGAAFKDLEVKMIDGY